jgi:hypothetical protein
MGAPLAIPYSRRFWVPREDDPDLSDEGFLVDPESELIRPRNSTAVRFESIDTFPVLGLLGEPGIGKTTALKSDHDRIKASALQPRESVFWIDLSLYGSDGLLDQRVFRSKRFSALKNVERVHLFFDGFDLCLLRIPNLVGLLLEFLSRLPTDHLSLRIACRTAAWPAELESGLRELWAHESVGVFQLSPFRRSDVHHAVESCGFRAADFLREIAHLGAAPLANRPITLLFLLNLWGRGKGLPSTRTDLYREGCLVLCDEWRENRRRERRLSSGLLFAIASRAAAVLTFCGYTAIWRAPRSEPPEGQDVRLDELLGRHESFERETINVGQSEMNEALDTGLFQSKGAHRLGFSHQTYVEYLSAQYLVERQVRVPTILGLIFHEDGSGKVVPQLRDTAAWLATMLPEVCQAILAKDPEALLLADDTPLAEADRADLVRQLLGAYDSGALIDENVMRTFSQRLEGARLKYSGLEEDLRIYVRGQDKRIAARRVAISIAELTKQTLLLQDLLEVALNEDEPHEVRTMAVMAIGNIGDETVKVSLKRLATEASANDLDDELKGGALIATWPQHLTVDELFAALTPCKKLNLAGMYQIFLWSDITSHLKGCDMCVALDWANGHVCSSPAGVNLLHALSLDVLASAIDFFREPGVCDRLASILVARAGSYFVHHERLAAKLQANPDARHAIARLAIRKARDFFRTRELARMGLVLVEDLPYLPRLLNPDTAEDEQRKIAFLIRDILCHVPWPEIEGFEQVVAARAYPAVSEVLQPLLGPIAWPSIESEQLKAEYELDRRRREAASPPPPSLDDQLAALLATGDHRVFERICLCLLGNSPPTQNRDDELLPRWSVVRQAIQFRMIEEAGKYLKGRCPINDLSFIRLGQLSYHVMFGFWALRLLSVNGPAAFNSIDAGVWRDWMPCVFGDPFSESVVDGRHEVILKAAYRFAPGRFLEILEELVRGQNARSGSIHILDRVGPLWDERIAAFLRANLNDPGIKLQAFTAVLKVLIEAGDDLAIRIATDLATNIPLDEDADLGRPLAAAFQLLSRDAKAGWQIAWPVVEANARFATGFYAKLAFAPFSEASLDLIHHLREDQLADMYLWLAKHGGPAEIEHSFGMVTSQRALVLLGRVVIDQLANRGTKEAHRQICRIQETLPDKRIEFLSKSAEELVRRNTWRPVPTTELLTLVIDGTRTEGGGTAPSTAKKRGRPAKIDVSKKRAAAAARKSGATWKEVAKLLYGTYPTSQQVKNAPNILKNYKKSIVQPPNKS